MQDNRRVFISYSHDDEAHREWVRSLADFLRMNGIDILLDQWDVGLGDDLAAFMERGIQDTDSVLVICTDNYVRRANEGTGGVGYEKTIVTAEILRDHKSRGKFIPVVRNVMGKHKMPAFFGAALYIDLSDKEDSEEQRQKLLRRLHQIPVSKPPLGASPFLPVSATNLQGDAENDEPKIPSLRGKSCIAEFSDRFSSAFPGLRGVSQFDEANSIAQRLGVLLREPLTFQEGHLAGWWRGPENLHIDRYQHIEGSHFLIDIDVLNIRRIVAVNPGFYYGKWVYVEAEEDEPTGLYDSTAAGIPRQIESFGYASEEYGLVDDKLTVTRSEYDDGAALIDGKPEDLKGRVALRRRFISPYNFVIAPFESPINNKNFDDQFRSHLNDLLLGSDVFDEMRKAILQLPKRDSSE